MAWNASYNAQHGKRALVIWEQPRSRLACTSVQSDLGILCLSIDTTVSTDSVSGQQMPKPACANAQADLGLCCPQVEY